MIWIAILLLPGYALAQKSTAVILAAETPVALRLKDTLSSADAEVNRKVEFEVAEDVRAADGVAIPRGSYAWGTITAAARKSRMRRNGRLDIDLEAVCLPGGRPAALRAQKRGVTSGGPSEVAAGDSLFALPALPLMLFVWGKDVTIPAGREFTTYLAEDTPVELGGKAAKTCPTATTAPVETLTGAMTPDQLSTVTIRSVPAAAEIYIDEKFAGSTPAVVRLPAGEHAVRLLLAGWSQWHRVVATTPGGDTNLQVTLEQLVKAEQ